MQKALGAAAAAMALATGAHAEEVIDWGFVYKGDVAGVLDGGTSQSGRYLDNLELTADVALDRAIGWQGAHLFAHVLSNSGGAPNAIAETLQGVNNIEVERQRVKLYQLWIEQEFAGGSVLAGLYDLNSEFYVTETAGELIAPAFGIGSELAATGPNGPSIFPSTALSLRLKWNVAENHELKLALVNAEAGVIGDPDGVDDDFDHGALIVAEWAYAGDASFRVGVWGYTEEQDDIRETNGLGDPLQQSAHGAYASAESVLWRPAGRELAGFLRVGVSDGDTTDFVGGWQAGARLGPVFASRPESVFAIGVNQGVVSSKFRDNQRDEGISPAVAESALEITYADRIGPHITLQPDLQIIRDPGADKDRDDVVVGTVRVIVEF